MAYEEKRGHKQRLIFVWANYQCNVLFCFFVQNLMSPLPRGRGTMQNIKIILFAHYLFPLVIINFNHYHSEGPLCVKFIIKKKKK